MSEPIIQARALSRWYGVVMGLNDVDLEIGKGVTALLGPNGAGKSTLLKLVTGQIGPSQGEIRVLGMKPWGHPHCLNRIGYCSERDALYPGLTGRALVQWSCRMRGVTRREAKERAATALDRLGLGAAADRPMAGYSKGMRQRARLAAIDALDFDLYVLDEPTTGTDPVVRAEIISWVRRLGDEGKTVIVSSHLLTEVEQMTDRIVLILGGRVRARGSLEEIRALLDLGSVRLTLTAAAPRPLALALMQRADVQSVVIEREDQLVIVTSGAAALYEDLPRIAHDCGAGLEEVIAPEASLGGLFRRLTARRRSS